MSVNHHHAKSPKPESGADFAHRELKQGGDADLARQNLSQPNNVDLQAVTNVHTAPSREQVKYNDGILKLGSKGESVLSLKADLNAWAKKIGRTDIHLDEKSDLFDKATASAVELFQQANGIDKDTGNLVAGGGLKVDAKFGPRSSRAMDLALGRETLDFATYKSILPEYRAEEVTKFHDTTNWNTVFNQYPELKDKKSSTGWLSSVTNFLSGSHDPAAQATPPAALANYTPEKVQELVKAFSPLIVWNRGGGGAAIGNSHFDEPVDHSPGRLAGNSRRHGDASPEVQAIVIDKLIRGAMSRGMTSQTDIAHLLSTARVEGGFNPDAAATTSSGSNIGQFIDDTGHGVASQLGFAYSNANRFDLDTGVAMLVEHTKENIEAAKKQVGSDNLAQMYALAYAFHHDGPSLAYGGYEIGVEKVLPGIARALRTIAANPPTANPTEVAAGPSQTPVS